MAERDGFVAHPGGHGERFIKSFGPLYFSAFLNLLIKSTGWAGEMVARYGGL